MSCVGEPSPPKLEGKLQTTGNALKVNWIKQDDGGSPIKHYLIRYRAVSMTEQGGVTLCIPICFLVFSQETLFSTYWLHISLVLSHGHYFSLGKSK